MPPEQAGDSGVEPGPYSDVYSLGAILFHLLTGRPPFDEGPFLLTLARVRSTPPPAPRALQPDVPAGLERVCLRCLAKQPEERYPSPLALAEELRRFTRKATAPPTAAGAFLLAVPTGEAIPLAGPSMVVGRSRDCDIVLEAPEVSRRHCRIVHEDGGVFVEDLGSVQGTRLNGSPVTRARLRDGDRLEIARELFQVQLG
jgi:hypothetical protein